MQLKEGAAGGHGVLVAGGGAVCAQQRPAGGRAHGRGRTGGRRRQLCWAHSGQEEEEQGRG
jgi:hypothetical protein